MDRLTLCNRNGLYFLAFFTLIFKMGLYANNSWLNSIESPYQDILIKNQIVKKGTNNCQDFYTLLQPICQSFKNKPFTVLDLGAAQGYFSLKIAHDYPFSRCIMIDDNTPSWPNHGILLERICLANSHLKNIVYLRETLDLSDLKYLRNHEHFDICLASFFIHTLSSDLDEQKAILNELLHICDNLIVQVSYLVAPLLTKHIESLSKTLDCTYLGEVCRYKKPYPKGIYPGYVYWFKTHAKKKKVQKNPPLGITIKTFEKFNGIYPQLNFQRMP